jgi:hypothetical protein
MCLVCCLGESSAPAIITYRQSQNTHLTVTPVWLPLLWAPAASLGPAAPEVTVGVEGPNCLQEQQV